MSFVFQRSGLLPRSDDCFELLCYECSAADEAAVDVRACEELGCVFLVARATVKDRGVVSSLLAELLCYEAADERVDLLSLLRRSGQTCTDSPNGLVSEGDVCPLLSAQMEY